MDPVLLLRNTIICITDLRRVVGRVMINEDLGVAVFITEFAIANFGFLSALIQTSVRHIFRIPITKFLINTFSKQLLKLFLIFFLRLVHSILLCLILIHFIILVIIYLLIIKTNFLSFLFLLLITVGLTCSR